MNKHFSKKFAIIRILSIIFSGVIGAVLLSGLMVYFYSPSGQYLSKDIILSPDIIKQMQISEGDLKKRNAPVLLIDRTLFSYLEAGKLRQQVIDIEVYKRFYDMVDSDKSLLDSDMILEMPYKIAPKLVLTTFIKDSMKGRSISTPFQIIEFADQDYYRVKLHDAKNIQHQEEWAYFHHPGIQKKMTAILSLLEHL